MAKKNDVLKQRTLTACICNSPVRRLGSVAAALAAAVVAVAAAEQSVAVSSSRPEMRRRCAGVGWVRQPQTPTLELEPGPETYEYRRKMMTMVIRNPYYVHVHIWTMKSSVMSPDSHIGRTRAAEPPVAPSTHSSSVAPAAPTRRWRPR